jgi:hypothetical protein
MPYIPPLRSFSKSTADEYRGGSDDKYRCSDDLDPDDPDINGQEVHRRLPPRFRWDHVSDFCKIIDLAPEHSVIGNGRASARHIDCDTAVLRRMGLGGRIGGHRMRITFVDFNDRYPRIMILVVVRHQSNAIDISNGLRATDRQTAAP